ncbi:hypothetical protein [uncultured Caulobacter sp.]|uniref:hypothetical protein n=1 Tax=uncultured Caulobacter sp. TaxID=158749 RepID=UPI002633EB8C|nr:hypothetical protein [uncultured Caulobacter sp.]
MITADAAHSRAASFSPARPRYRRRFREGARGKGFGKELTEAPNFWAMGDPAAPENGVFV